MSENNATMSAGMPASAPAFGSDVKRLPLKDLLKRIGPGLIATGIVIGPGAVTTASMIGANYGYDLMWLFFHLYDGHQPSGHRDRDADHPRHP